MYEYENLRRIVYDGGDDGKAVYIPVCINCGRFVKVDKYITINGLGQIKDRPNATCKKCGRVKMPFEGWI
jgi:hypothetical protein